MTDQTVKLPELPPEDDVIDGVPIFADKKMRAYATQAVLEERERCAMMAAKIASECWANGESTARWANFAAAIRGGKE